MVSPAKHGKDDARPAFEAQVLGIRRATYVEFALIAGDPVLSVELVLAYPAFKEFCAANGIVVQPIADETLRGAFERLAWRFGDRAQLVNGG